MACEHFRHEADIGVSGIGATPGATFSDAAPAPTAVVTDRAGRAGRVAVDMSSEAPDDDSLIADRPGASDPANPTTTWVHRVRGNLPASSTGLVEVVAPSALPPGTALGTNDWRRTRRGGRRPPIGRHRHFFELHALEAALPASLGAPTKAALEKAMHGHVLASAKLVGTYRKRR